MKGWLIRLGSLLASALLLASPHSANAGTDPPAEPVKPKLAVMVIFDQLRGDYLTRWQQLYDPHGFARLLNEGAWFQNCHYPYAVTVTGAGHASVLTGCSPYKHGIVGNEWYDRAAGQQVSCATMERYGPIPPGPSDGLGKGSAKGGAKGGGSPERLLVESLGDVLKAATDGKSKVVSLSFKDRAAILPAGRHPDACYWLDEGNGTFVTSTYYRAAPHPWVAAFNRQRPADRWFGVPWQRLRPDLDYVRYSGPDDVTGEGSGIGQGRTFPHPMNGGKAIIGKSYYEAFYNSPFGNDLLLELAKRAIDAEGLGTRQTPDLLCLSFSCNDPIGHCWGPDSQEVMDVTLRSDLVMKELLAYLDARLGKNGYVLVLSADHGVCPLPEVSAAQGKPALRVNPLLLARNALDFLRQKFGSAGKDAWLEKIADPWIYLNQRYLHDRGLSSAQVEKALTEWAAHQPGVQAAYSRSQMLTGVPETDPVGQAVRRSFYADRAGDLLLIPKPYCLIYSKLTGTTHGTPHEYDTHVPLLVYGRGVKPGIRHEAVSPLSCAAILAHALGIRAPSQAEAGVPGHLFGDQ